MNVCRIEKVICNKFSFAYDSNTFGIHDIDLTIQEGEFIVLTGKSGCGKTTLTRCINGLIPDFFEGTITGSCRVCGMDISEHETGDYSSYVGSVFQDPRSQFFTLHVKTEIPFPSENLGTPSSVIQDRFRNTVKQLNISNLLKKSIFELSSGEKQKVAIASIYTANVQIYVLDEPSANLDSDAMVRLGSLLYRLKEAGHTIILSEHRFHYVRDSFDRLVFMENGEITSIYSRSEALSLTEAQLAVMGLRPFQPPSFQVGGAFLSKPEDTLQVSKISCMLDGRQILEDVTFSVRSGGILAIAGPNGAGKSTLCRIITGLYRSMGTVQINGEYLKRKRRTKKSFFVQQDADYQLYAPTVVDEFLIGKRASPELRQAILKRLYEMGLETFADRHPASLSGGQKQRLLLALAAESGRKLMVFDEPTSGLDGYNMRLTVKLFRQLSAEGKCLLLITHDMDLIAAAADCVLYIDQGKVRYHRNVLRDI